MWEPVQKKHNQLLHYTTGAGLLGVIQSGVLHATNIAYLNDAEEHIGYFDRRLPDLIDKCAKDAGVDGKLLRTMGGAIKDVTLIMDSPFVTSFCGSANHPCNDGLLSQWRGYGEDGGYAIVFDTENLCSLLQHEPAEYYYHLVELGEVQYSHDQLNEQALLAETQEAEGLLMSAFEKFVRSSDLNDIEPAYRVIAKLCCFHKHHGFREENEVRIVAVLRSKIWDVALPEDDGRGEKKIRFRARNGQLVPFIPLFKSTDDDKPMLSAIREIIVGPHADNAKRCRAVEMLLAEHHIAAKVSVSDIPYLGR